MTFYGHAIDLYFHFDPFCNILLFYLICSPLAINTALIIPCPCSPSTSTFRPALSWLGVLGGLWVVGGLEMSRFTMGSWFMK